MLIKEVIKAATHPGKLLDASFGITPHIARQMGFRAYQEGKTVTSWSMLQTVYHSEWLNGWSAAHTLGVPSRWGKDRTAFDYSKGHHHV